MKLKHDRREIELLEELVRENGRKVVAGGKEPAFGTEVDRNRRGFERVSAEHQAERFHYRLEQRRMKRMPGPQQSQADSLAGCGLAQTFQLDRQA